jgi:protein TonB
MRVALLALSCVLLASCARDDSPPAEVVQKLAEFDAELGKLRDASAKADEKLPPDRRDFRGRTARQDMTQWVLPKSTLAAIERHRNDAQKAKTATEAEAVLLPARKLIAADVSRFSAITRYWMSALPTPFWREYWGSLYEANGVPVPAPDSMLVAIEGDMRSALERGDFAQAPAKSEELLPVLETAIDGATARLAREVGAPAFAPRRTECPRGVEPERGQTKPRLVDSRPINDFYPPAAIARGETGSLVLRARVDARGCAKEFAIVVRSGVASLNAAALEWFETARYSPAMRGGRPVDAEHTFKVKFVLR